MSWFRPPVYRLTKLAAAYLILRNSESISKPTRQNSPPQSQKVLDEVIATLLVLGNVQLEIQAYTDDQGAKAYNKDLSRKRANSVMEYLKAQGVERSRMTAVGYGEDNPIADNTSAEGRAKNRRVEFKVLSAH